MLTWILILAAAAAGALRGPGLVAHSVLAVTPMLVFLTAALGIAELASRAGLADRAALGLARAAGGRGPRLYVLVCVTCGLLTAAVSLDGAVVLMVPVLRGLERHAGAPFRALLLGTIGVANAFSCAVPQGNPTNLVIAQQIGIAPARFVERMLVPALVAALLCAGAAALRERKALGRKLRAHVPKGGPLAPRELLAASAVGAAAAAGVVSPLLGVAAWWPVALVAAAALVLGRMLPRVPWRIALQVGSLLVVCSALDLARLAPHGTGPAVLVGTALAASAAAALLNNLPVSVAVATSLSGPAAYAGLVGLSVGALATPHGSVATMIADDLAGGRGPARSHLRLWVPAAAAATGAAVFLLWLGG